MYVEASQGQTWDLAKLESVWLKQAASACVVSFWYHMYGRGIGTLYVYIKVGLTYTLVFEEYGNKGKAKRSAATILFFHSSFRRRRSAPSTSQTSCFTVWLGLRELCDVYSLFISLILCGLNGQPNTNHGIQYNLNVDPLWPARFLFETVKRTRKGKTL